MISTVNRQTQLNLIEMMGEKAFQALIAESIPFFVEKSSQLMLTLHNEDWAKARAVSHAFKGTFGTMGYEALFHTLDVLEQQLKIRPPNVPDWQAMQHIQHVLQHTEAALRAV
jgi:HPt (histidine-containing phosphotransfer) domain-containing protein